ncbi:DUF4382 domain-containing protein [Psychroserpens sp. BH13MA-6]
MTSQITFKSIVFCVLSFVFLNSCSKEYDTETFDNSSLVTVKLQGTESVFSEAKIDILDVQLRVMEDVTNPNAWVSLHAINTGVHDLSDITNDDVVTLVDFEEVPVGFIYDIKLVLGDDHTVKKNGIEYTLHCSEAYESASINMVQKELVANMVYDFLIEFEIDDSVTLNSTGDAQLNPKMNTLLRRFELF